MRNFVTRMLTFVLMCTVNMVFAAEVATPLSKPAPRIDPRAPKIDPQAPKIDPRIRTIDYVRDEIVTINGYFGFDTYVELDPDEEIDEDASSLGFIGPWKIKALRNKFKIKPFWEKKEKGTDGNETLAPFPSNVESNLTIITDKRMYLFTLKCMNRCIASSSEVKGMTYLLRFRFPDPRFIGSDDPNENRRNYLYSAQSMPGTEGDDPAYVWDNGIFTYLRFYKLQEIPAVFIVNQDGTESVIDTSVQHGDTIVIPRVVRKLILRKGEKYATFIMRENLLDRTFGPNTGTEVPGMVKDTRKPK